MVESKRIKKFRLSIAKTIPKFPNDKASLQFLEAKSLASLLVDYANWASRYVTPRPRRVHVAPTALSDRRWRSLSTEITAFLDKVKRGEELTPHLSLDLRTRGFTPAISGLGPDVNRWADKDMLLNGMGYHHFHLGLTMEPAGHAKRTDDVLFAAVTREQFEDIALFDHSVFEMNRTPTKVMSTERKRLWDIFRERSTRDLPSGSAVIMSGIATSGHALHFSRMADHYAQVVSEIDPKLDDPSFVRDLYKKAGVPAPPKPKVCWHLHFMDLGLLDEAQGVFFVFRDGPN